ncbi:hypothetical protein BaRGS_00003799 [Batillaria attramentaria]|uniref:Uncharacterized protein n=1 Tax=Batillaria attramentaria TaxID=370345 RepID=A0ABD0LZU2_9CAEN
MAKGESAMMHLHTIRATQSTHVAPTHYVQNVFRHSPVKFSLEALHKQSRKCLRQSEQTSGGQMKRREEILPCLCGLGESSVFLATCPPPD